MLRKMIEAAVERALDRRTIRPDNKLTLTGYHPLPEIMGALYEWLLVPFNGSLILVEIRYLRSTQLPEVDKLYSVIDEQSTERKLSRDDMIAILNIQEACCKAVLNRPTFQELEQAITGKDRVLEDNKKRFKALEAAIKTVNNEAERRELTTEKERLELFCGYILPDDTMTTVTNIALGMDVSDIRKLTKEKLLLAYSKARLYGGRPSDFVPGIFTDGDRQNIDDYATLIGGENEKERRRRQVQ